MSRRDALFDQFLNMATPASLPASPLSPVSDASVVSSRSSSSAASALEGKREAKQGRKRKHPDSDEQSSTPLKYGAKTAEEERDIKKARRRQQNRDAAQQSRLRKKKQLVDMEERLRILAAEKKQLEDTVMQLQEEKQQLQAQLGLGVVSQQSQSRKPAAVAAHQAGFSVTKSTPTPVFGLPSTSSQFKELVSQPQPPSSAVSLAQQTGPGSLLPHALTPILESAALDPQPREFGASTCGVKSSFQLASPTRSLASLLIITSLLVSGPAAASAAAQQPQQPQQPQAADGSSPPPPLPQSQLARPPVSRPRSASSCPSSPISLRTLTGRRTAARPSRRRSWLSSSSLEPAGSGPACGSGGGSGNSSYGQASASRGNIDASSL